MAAVSAGLSSSERLMRAIGLPCSQVCFLFSALAIPPSRHSGWCFPGTKVAAAINTATPGYTPSDSSLGNKHSRTEPAPGPEPESPKCFTCHEVTSQKSPLLLCALCNNNFHRKCLSPPLSKNPKVFF